MIRFNFNLILQNMISVLKKRWTSIKDCYRKALLKRKTKNDQTTKTNNPWKFEI